jgi:hypothetical protein
MLSIGVQPFRHSGSRCPPCTIGCGSGRGCSSRTTVRHARCWGASWYTNGSSCSDISVSATLRIETADPRRFHSAATESQTATASSSPATAIATAETASGRLAPWPHAAATNIDAELSRSWRKDIGPQRGIRANRSIVPSNANCPVAPASRRRDRAYDSRCQPCRSNHATARDVLHSAPKQNAATPSERSAPVAGRTLRRMRSGDAQRPATNIQ